MLLLKGFSQLVSKFSEASRNFILDVLHKMTAKNCIKKKLSVNTISTVLYLGPSNKIFI
jgi:hypothetical protein